LFQDIIVHPHCLRQIGIYSNDSNEPLSREPTNDWIDLCHRYRADLDEDELARKLLAVKDEDYDVLTHSVLEGIKVATDLVLNNQIKVHEVVPRAGYIISHATRIDLEKLDNENVDSIMNTADVTSRQVSRLYNRRDDVNNGTSYKLPSALKFYGQDVTLNPIIADLSKKADTCMIADYTLRLRKMILKIGGIFMVMILK